MADNELESVATDNSNDEHLSTGGSEHTEVSGAHEEHNTATNTNVETKKSSREMMSEAFDKLKQDKADKAKQTETGKRELKAAPVETTQQPTAVAEDIDPISGKKLEPIKAPQGLPPSLRESWSKLPRDYQQYWSQRELDMARNFSQLGASKKFAESIQNAGKPFEPLLRQLNLNLEQFTQGLFNDSKVLYQGSPQQKAVIIGNLIRQFQPHPDTLKSILAGKAVNVQPPKAPVNVEDEVQKRLHSERQKQAEQAFQPVLDSFFADPSNEFAHDVEKQMEAIINGQLVATEGRSPVEILKDAYTLAIKQHPEISKIIAGRGTQQQAQPAVQPVKAVRSAKPSPGAGKSSSVPQKGFRSTREAAMAAYEELNSRK